MQVLMANDQWHLPEVQELVTSPAMHRLVITNAATVAQRQHSWMRGKSPVPPEPLTYLGIASSSSSNSKVSSSKASSSKAGSRARQQQQQQHLAIPTHHEALLSALGLAGFNSLTLSGRSAATSDEHNSMAVSIAAVHCLTVKRRDANNNSSSSQELALPGLTDTGLALPLALLLVEALLLAPSDVELAGPALSMLLLGLQAHHAHSITAEPELLQAVLHLAAPSVLHTLAQARASGVAEILTADDEMKADIMINLATLVMRLTLPGESRSSVTLLAVWMAWVS
jgi:hypothetical protein